MSTYFVHLRGGLDDTLDQEGVEFVDLDAVRAAVLLTARDLMAGDIRNGVIDLRCRIDAEDEGGAVVCSLPFGGAVEIIPRAA